MAEALLRDRLARVGVSAHVRSAGELRGGVPASAGSVRAMAQRGLDLSGHVSQTVSPQLVGGADLVLAMARRHLRYAVSLRPDAWPRTFTIKELVRRGREVGRRGDDEPLDRWLARVHDGRVSQALLGDDPLDDVADPIGGPDHLYDATAAELGRLIDELVDLAFGVAHDRETA